MWLYNVCINQLITSFSRLILLLIISLEVLQNICEMELTFSFHLCRLSKSPSVEVLSVRTGLRRPQLSKSQRTTPSVPVCAVYAPKKV